MRITAKFDGKCAKCGGSIAKGSAIEYEKKTSSAWHPECFEDEGGQQDLRENALAALCEAWSLEVMNITDEALSRWIAEKLEPQPASKEEYCAVCGHTEELRDSPVGAWRCDFDVSARRMLWQPRDMVHDPALTVMLLSKLLVSGTQVIITATDGGYEVQVEFPKPVPMFCLSRVFAETDRHLGRAVAEAWATANGLAASELEGK